MATDRKLDPAQAAVTAALRARAVELEIDPDSIWCPSPRAVAARRYDGAVIRIDYGIWPARELRR